MDSSLLSTQWKFLRINCDVPSGCAKLKIREVNLAESNDVDGTII
ncbi:MAG: hypothetical protein H6Q69_2112 [Firmicutes bacterium]|nr:hypothetical protein [Bacillota bacterium]